jgi:hypothetical protein
MVYLFMALMKLRDRQHEAATMRRVLRAIFFCVFFATGLTSCATAPVSEKAQITKPERHALEPKELAGKAANVTEFTTLVYAEETIDQAKTIRDRIRITVISQALESAKKEARSFYATGMLIAKVLRPDAEGRQHIELSVENRGKTSIQRTNTEKKFVARDGKSYDILWGVNKDGESCPQI